MRPRPRRTRARPHARELRPPQEVLQAGEPPRGPRPQIPRKEPKGVYTYMDNNNNNDFISIINKEFNFGVSRTRADGAWGPGGDPPASGRVCVYIYICIYTHIHIHIYIHTYVCIYTYIYIYIYRERELDIHTHTSLSLYIYISMFLSIYLYIYICYRYLYLSLSLSFYVLYIYI